MLEILATSNQFLTVTSKDLCTLHMGEFLSLQVCSTLACLQAVVCVHGHTHALTFMSRRLGNIPLGLLAIFPPHMLHISSTHTVHQATMGFDRIESWWPYSSIGYISSAAAFLIHNLVSLCFGQFLHIPITTCDVL